jgi:hypothetical protein
MPVNFKNILIRFQEIVKLLSLQAPITRPRPGGAS